MKHLRPLMMKSAEDHDLFTAGHGGQVLLLLGLIAAQQQRAAAQRVRGVGVDGQHRVHAGQFLYHQGIGQAVGTGAAVLLGNLDTHEAVTGHLLVHIPVEFAGLVQLVLDLLGEFRLRELAEQLALHLVLLVENHSFSSYYYLIH